MLSFHVKFVQTDRRKDRQTEVKQYAPDPTIRGTKKTRCIFETWMSLQLPIFEKLWLTDDNDLGTKEKVLHPRNTHVKYESSITYLSKLMANVKVSFIQTDKQMQGHKKS